MGVMSKGQQRLSERPLPPSTAERDSDILSVDDSDIVFSLGQKYLVEYYQVSPSTTPTHEHAPSNTSTNTTGNVVTSSSTTTNSNTSLNASTDSDTSQEQVKQSYDDVVRLMSLYSSLKHVPSELEEKYSTLKTAADELSGSISQLRALSLTFGAAENSGSSAKKCIGNDKDVKKSSNKTVKTRKR